MKDFDINEYYDINRDTASVRGFFFLKDEDGNILRTNENMILKSGRQLIMGRFLKNPNADKDYNSETMYMLFGSDNTLSRPDMNGLNSYEGLVAANSDDEYDGLYIKYSATINSSVATTIGEFGLALQSTNNIDYKTITRVVFPLIHLNSGSTYKVEYYIYF